MRGRTLVGLLLSGFIFVALAIVWRRTIGIGQAENLSVLESRKTQLEGERIRLQNEIREASSRRRLGEVVERRLGMRIPTDDQVIILPGRRGDGRP